MTTNTLPANEREAVKIMLTAVVAAGYTLRHVNDGEENIAADSIDYAVEAATQTEMAWVYFKRPGHPGTSHIWFVYGNDFAELPADYTTDLEDVLTPITDAWGEIEAARYWASPAGRTRMMQLQLLGAGSPA